MQVVGVFLVVIVFNYGCQSKQKSEENLSYPTEGQATIGVDNSLVILADHLDFVFENTYPKATLTQRYYNENELIAKMTNDSFNMIIMSRMLNENELKYYKTINLNPVHQHFASDALAIITSSNNDSIITLKDLKSALLSSTEHWYAVLFNTQSKSSLMAIIQNKKQLNNAPSHYYGIESIDSVVLYLNKNKKSFALINIQEYEKLKPTLMGKKCQLVGVETILNNQKTIAFPFQSYIADSTYPLVRKLYTITVEGRSGLGTGFASFISSYKGQLVVLRDGYLPATMPQRQLNIKNGF